MKQTANGNVKQSFFIELNTESHELLSGRHSHC